MAELFLGGQHAEVVLERAVHRVEHRDRYHLVGARSGGHAAQEDARRECRRRAARRRLILRGNVEYGDQRSSHQEGEQP